MKLSEVKKLLNADVIFGEEMIDQVEVETAFASDLLSDVLAYSKENALFLTGLTNPQVIRTVEVLDLVGVVMTMYDGRTKLAQQVVGEVRQHFGDKVFETMIPRSTRLAEAPSFGKPVLLYDKDCAGSESYRNLAKEVMSYEPKSVG